MEISIKWSMCRVCTTDHSSELHSLHSPKNLSSVYLKAYAGLEVNPTDGLPDKICSDCVKQLQIVHRFIEKCKQSNEYLKNLVLCTMSPSTLFYQSTSKTKEQMHMNNSDELLQVMSTNCLTEGNDNEEVNTGTACVAFIGQDEQTHAKVESLSTDGGNSNDYTLEHTKAERQSVDGDGSSIDYTTSDLLVVTQDEEFPEAVTLPPDVVDLGVACKPSNYHFQFSCSTCGDWFSTEPQLLVHTRTHRKEKSYECELCSKRFNAACNLTTHMRTHTGEKPFKCTFCERAFADRSTLRKHERTHTKERPYACSICGKTFSLSTSRKAHFLSHTGEKPHKCVTCNKGFCLPHQLKAHLKSHAHQHELEFQNEED